MREHIAADEPFAREDVTVDAGARALPRRGPGLQGRADRGPGRRTTASRPSRSTPTARSPTSAAARTRRAPSASARSSCSRSRAPTGAATPTARCSRASTAPPSSSRTSSTRTSSARAGAGARPPQARPRARAVHVLAGLAGLDLLAAEGHRALQRARRAQPRACSSERGYVEVKTPLLYESQLWETSGHWGKYKENIFVSEYEDREFGLKPMNCPGHCAAVRAAALVLPRPAGALRRAGPAAPQRAAAARCTA